MSNYENAPATILVATYCACCARPLVDATSVETGIGPDCRKKHGFDAPDRDVALVDAIALAASLPEDVAASFLEGASSTRQLANRIVHRIACEQSGDLAIALTNVLARIGFERLSGRVMARLAKVEITVASGGGYLVSAPYSEHATLCFRKVPGRRWDRETKQNTFPAASKAALFDALKRSYPGAVARGPKGLFVL